MILDSSIDRILAAMIKRRRKLENWLDRRSPDHKRRDELAQIEAVKRHGQGVERPTPAIYPEEVS